MATDPKIKFDIAANVSGEPEVSRLAGALDGLADTLEGDLKTQAAASALALRELGAQNAAIQAFVKLKQEGRDAANGLLAAQQAAEKLGAELAQVEKPTRVQAGQLQKLHDEIRTGTKAVDANKVAIAGARAALDQYGIATTGLGATQATLRTALTSARDAAVKMVPALEEIAKQSTASKESIANAAKVMDESFRVLGVQSVRSLESEIKKLQSALVLIKANADILPAEKRAAVSAFNTEVARLKLEAKGAGTGLQELEASSARTGNALAEAGHKAAAWGAALGGLSAIKSVAQDVVSTGAEFETLRVRLENLLGGTQQAATAFNMIKTLAATTPFEVTALTESFVKLTAMGMQPTEAQMRSLSDVAANLGGGTENLSGITLALGQAWAKGKLQGEEINQMAERGVPVWDALTRATGRTVPELQRMSEAGELGRDVITRLIDALGQQNLGASAKLMATYSGAVSNAKDAMAEFYDLVAQSGVLDFLTRKLQGLLAEFERMKASGELEQKAKALADGFVTVASAVEQAAKVIAFLGPELLKLGQVMAAMKVVSFAQSLYAIGTAAVSSAAGMGTLGVQAAASAVSMETAAVAGTRVAGVLRLLRSLSGIGLVIGVAELAGEFLRAKNAAEEGDKAFTKMMAERPSNGPKKAALEVSGALAAVPQKADDVRKSFDRLIEKGDTAAEAIGKIGKDFDLSNVPGIRTAATVLDGLVVDGKITADLFSKTWTDALKSVDLKDFETRARQAFDGSFEGALRLQGVLDTALRESIRRAGLDFDVIRGGMGKAAQSAINDTEAMINGLDKLKAQGVDTAQALTASIGKGINTADSQKAIDAVKLQIESLRSKLGDKLTDGLLDQAKQKANDLKDALDKATPGINSLREAYAQLGLKTSAELGKIASTNKSAWEEIRKDAAASAETLKSAFSTYAQSAIAASGNVGSYQRLVTEETLKSDAAAKGLAVTFDAAGKMMVQTQAEAAAAIAKTTGALGGQKDAVDSVTSALERQNAAQERSNAAVEKAAELERKRLGVDKEGFSTDKNGQRINAGSDLGSLTGIAAFLKNAGVADDNVARKIAREFADDKGNVIYANNPGQRAYGGDTISMALLKAAESYTFGIGGNSANAKQTGVGEQPSTIPQPNTVNVRITLPNGSVQTVPTTQDGSTALIAALQSAKLSAGL